MKAARLFTSYLSAGLLTTALAALAFTRLSVIGFALLGLTLGIATRNLRRCFTGLCLTIASS